MKIDASKKVLNLKGEPYKMGDDDLCTGHVLAESLSTMDLGGKMKIYELAKRCFALGQVEVNAGDMALLKKAVDEHKGFANVVAGQVLEQLEAVK